MRPPLERFSTPTRAWFSSAFEAPTDAQTGAWEAIGSGRNALVVAPTGSGKTLAAFLWSIDRLITAPAPAKKQRLRVLYISPLKALAVDVERNLRSPLTGIEAAAARLGVATTPLNVGVRTGDTPAEDRRKMLTAPPDILITTPESLFLLLTSQAREALRNIDAVIIDEVHAVAGSKRGAHLALSLERLDELLAQPAQRIGLSATVRPLDEVARFLGGPHPVDVVESSTHKQLDISVVVPVEDMNEPAANRADAKVEERTSIWPAVEERLVTHIRAHRSTIVFCNSRRLAERLCGRINEAAGTTIARAHHGSVAREQRMLIEEELKSGRLPCVVATSSLELGIDMGAVDLVIQIEAPSSVASGLQRIGRAGHHVGVVSRGIIFPKFRGDLLESAVVAERMRARDIESTRVPRNPLDVLAQHVVAMCSMEPWNVDALEALVRRAMPFADLPRSALESVLDMLSGRYPSDAFAELRPRVTWDRVTDELQARPGAQRLAVTSGGTIPDRGLFGVHLASDGTRVGELDEEMVYESRPGETFVLGASTWRIEDITRDRVIVSPAPGEPGKMPFWHGDAPGRPVELGRALGTFIREIGALDPPLAEQRARDAGLDDYAARNLLAYLSEQRDATGALPDDHTIVVERFRDELGDWRLCVHTPFGARVHAPWSLAIEARVRERLGLEAQTIYSDDGIVVRLPEADEAPPLETILFEPDEISDLVVEQVGGSALFASRFREAAVRSLLIPRRRPGQRTPLWQQRQRSADLMAVASSYGEFPVVLEAYRECLQDAFDLPALVELLAQIQRREISVVEVETQMPSPFASSLTFGYVGAFIYEGDAPLAERRAAALTLDRRILGELLGQEELRDLVDAAALAELELTLQRLTPERAIRDADDLHDALRTLGDLSADEVVGRTIDTAAAKEWLEQLVGTRRALVLRIAGEDRFTAIEDAARFRDALGTAMPVGVPEAFLAPVAAPLEDLVSRFARTHGPFGASDVAARLGLGAAVVERALRVLQASGRVVLGAFRPGGSEREWIDAEVLRILRRKSLAAFRKEVEPVEASALARFLPVWHGVGARRGGMDALLRAIESLQGAPLPASALERQVLGARGVGEDVSRLLDEVTASGEVVWTGTGALGPNDGWVVVALAEQAPLLLPDPLPGEPSPAASRVLEALRDRGALFFRDIGAALGSTDDRELLEAIWELVWSGHVTNDTIAPLRALVGTGSRAAVQSGRRRARPAMPARFGPPSGAGRWSLLPARETDRTRRSFAVAEQVLRRHGVVTRGTVVAERLSGGFAAAYQVMKAFEERGRARRGYFVEGLGGAQFAVHGAVDRLRHVAADRAPAVHVLAAADPANPFGATLPWPDRPGHRPGRKAGASVVLVDGSLALYVEKGGRSVLTFIEEPDGLARAVLARAVAALGDAVRDGRLGGLTIEKADGAPLPASGPLIDALAAAGFAVTPRGMRLRT
ncbi:MAG TPA: DEAD/DEAH box helicase [Actinomycetota bacterium]